MSQAYYHSTTDAFLNKNTNEILGQLNSRGAEFFRQFGDVVTSWESSIEILKESLSELTRLNLGSKEWSILLEYEIPRLNSRIDVILLADDLIFVIELSK